MTIGLLALADVRDGDHAVEVVTATYRRIALEQVGLSLGNLKLRETLREQSMRDVLTGLYNRRFLNEAAQLQVMRAARLQAQGRQSDVAVIMLDIDHFKDFNDEYGHEAGDQVLREVAHALRRHARGSDVVARCGGEEFAIVLADTALEQALTRAEQIRIDVEALTPHTAGKPVGNVTISIGLAQFPEHGTTLEDLLLAADRALYEAKHAGRNRVVVAH